MKILVSLSGIFCFFSLLYFFIMNIILSAKSFKLFWKDRYDPKYEEIWGDRVLMFYPLFLLA